MEAFNKEFIVELAVFALAIAFVLVFVIDALKNRGVIPAGKAGHWNQFLSTITGFLVFYLTYTGNQGRIATAREAAIMIAATVVYVIVQIIFSKAWHDLLEWVQGKKPFPVQLPFTKPVDPKFDKPQ